MKGKSLRVHAIKNGTVIDHLPRGKGIEIIRRLKLVDHDHTVTLGIGFESKQLGAKDIVKIEDKELTQAELNQVAILAPHATLNIIRNYKPVLKKNLHTPHTLVNIIRCKNPSCVTNHEPLESIFLRVNPKEPYSFQCRYCQKVFAHDEIAFL